MDVWRRSIENAVLDKQNGYLAEAKDVKGKRLKDDELLVKKIIVPIMVGKGEFSKPFVVNGVTRYLEYRGVFDANQVTWNQLRKTKKEIEEGDPEITEKNGTLMSVRTQMKRTYDQEFKKLIQISKRNLNDAQRFWEGQYAEQLQEAAKKTLNELADPMLNGTMNKVEIDGDNVSRKDVFTGKQFKADDISVTFEFVGNAFETCLNETTGTLDDCTNLPFVFVVHVKGDSKDNINGQLFRGQMFDGKNSSENRKVKFLKQDGLVYTVDKKKKRDEDSKTMEEAFVNAITNTPILSITEQKHEANSVVTETPVNVQSYDANGVISFINPYGTALQSIGQMDAEDADEAMKQFLNRITDYNVELVRWVFSNCKKGGTAVIRLNVDAKDKKAYLKNSTKTNEIDNDPKNYCVCIYSSDSSSKPRVFRSRELEKAMEKYIKFPAANNAAKTVFESAGLYDLLVECGIMPLVKSSVVIIDTEVQKDLFATHPVAKVVDPILKLRPNMRSQPTLTVEVSARQSENQKTDKKITVKLGSIKPVEFELKPLFDRLSGYGTVDFDTVIQSWIGSMNTDGETKNNLNLMGAKQIMPEDEFEKLYQLNSQVNEDVKAALKEKDSGVKDRTATKRPKKARRTYSRGRRRSSSPA